MLSCPEFKANMPKVGVAVMIMISLLPLLIMLMVIRFLLIIS